MLWHKKASVTEFFLGYLTPWSPQIQIMLSDDVNKKEYYLKYMFSVGVKIENRLFQSLKQNKNKALDKNFGFRFYN